MKRSYNKSQVMQGRPPGFDPTFWEVSVDPSTLNEFANEQSPHYESEEEFERQRRREERNSRILPHVQNLIDLTLTQRQRTMVRLYFFEQLTEREIASELNISTPSVSQHLFGKSRGGRKVGGAIPKLRRKLIQQFPDFAQHL